jgi:hypothetical protein
MRGGRELHDPPEGWLIAPDTRVGSVALRDDEGAGNVR